MFISAELIEETRRPPVLIFGMKGYLWPGSDKLVFWNFCANMTEFRRNYHIFESVKNYINSYISRPIRDRNTKT